METTYNMQYSKTYTLQLTHKNITYIPLLNRKNEYKFIMKHSE